MGFPQSRALEAALIIYQSISPPSLNGVSFRRFADVSDELSGGVASHGMCVCTRDCGGERQKVSRSVQAGRRVSCSHVTLLKIIMLHVESSLAIQIHLNIWY